VNHYDVKATRLRRKGKNKLDLLIKTICFTRYSLVRSSSLFYSLRIAFSLSLFRAITRSSSLFYSLRVTHSHVFRSASVCSALPQNVLAVMLLHAIYNPFKPCFVTRKTMAEGAKKHDDFRLPT